MPAKRNVMLGHHKKNMRFNVSLIILSAVLEVSIFILLISLINAQSSPSVAGASANVPTGVPSKAMVKAADQKLSDPALDFELTIPAAMGEWLYKTGNVKSLVDDTKSDQYLQIYLPATGTPKSRNFEDLTKTILTIRKFTADEWKKMDKSCSKGNTDYCDAIGTIINNIPRLSTDTVYGYTKMDNCPKELAAKCDLVDKIIGSIKIK